MTRRPLLWLGALLLAEVAGRSIGPLSLVILDAIVLVGLVNVAARLPAAGDRELLMALAVVAAVRLLSVALPLGDDRLMRYSVIGVAALLAVVMAARALAYTGRQLGLHLGGRSILLSIVALASGVGLSFLVYPTLGLSVPLNRSTVFEAPLPALLLLISTGFIEELMLRGLVLRAAARRLGDVPGLLYVALLSGAVSIDRWSPEGLMVGVVAAFALGALTLWSGSVIPAALGHGIFNVALLMFVPFLPERAVG